MVFPDKSNNSDHPIFMKDNFYNLEDNLEKNIDDESIEAVNEYSIEDSVEKELLEESEMWNGQKMKTSDKKRSALGMMLTVMFNPVEGFKMIRRSKITSDKFASECFYPLITLASVASFTQLFYDTESTLISSIIDVIVTFMSMFFGYFTTLLCGKWLLLKEPSEALGKDYGKIFLMTAFCSLSLFYILFRLFPLLAPVWAMLPIWTIYIIWRGTKFLGVNEGSDSRTKVILSFLTIFMPIVWNWIFSEILPQ